MVKVSENNIKWQKSMIIISMAGMKNWVEKFECYAKLLSFCHTRRTASCSASRPNEHDSLHRFICYSYGSIKNKERERERERG